MLWFLTYMGWANTALIFALVLTPAVALLGSAPARDTARMTAGRSAQVAVEVALTADSETPTEGLQN